MNERRSGRPARRAVVRWALRLLRREWRQHVLVTALLTVTVGAALFGATTAFNLAPSHDARFGLANHRFEILFEGTAEERSRLDEFVADAEEWFGHLEVITERHLEVPGSTERLELRWQDPAGVLAAPMLELIEGSYPAGDGEVALTDQTAQLLDTSLGSTVEVDGNRLTVVGMVENPDQLDDEFALLAPDTDAAPDTAILLMRSDGDRVNDFRSDAAPTSWSIEPRGQSEKTLAAIGALVAATVAMLLVTLVAAAAFVVIAHRRQHQLGLLAAAGATERNVRLMMIADGAGVGLTAAVVGAAAAFAAWIVAAPAMETAVGRRLDRLDVPWWVVTAGIVLAVVTAVAAAWWPARTIARLPIMSALSGRPPRPRRARRSSVAALALLVGGVVAMTFAIDPSKDTGSVPLVLAGVIASTLGLVLLAPSAVRAAGALGRRSPLAVRVALRDLARYQSRSGAALAAISLGLAIAVSVVIIAAANEDAAAEGNLSDHHVLLHIGDRGEETELYMPEIPAPEVDAQGARVDEWAATLADPTVVPLVVAVDEAPAESVSIDGRTHHPTVILGIPVSEETTRDSGLLYVATPELLDYLEIDAATIDAETILLTREAGPVRITGNITWTPQREEPIEQVQRIEMSPFSSIPHALITEHGVDFGNWAATPSGWLIESAEPITDEQLSAARDMAAASGLTVETRDDQAGLSTIRTAATGIGIAVALAILAMTVGLIRAESSGDVRTLTAVGASSRTRRAVTAATAGSLAMLAVVLATVIAYAAVIAGYTPETERLGNVPVAHLMTIAIGFPLVAVTASWLLAGRQPRHIARQLTE